MILFGTDIFKLFSAIIFQLSMLGSENIILMHILIFSKVPFQGKICRLKIAK